MFGGHLPDTDDWTFFPSYQQRGPDVLNSNSGNRQLYRDGDKVVRTAKGPDRVYVALFNLADSPQTVEANLADIGLPQRSLIRDLWEKQDIGTVDTCISVEVPRMGQDC